jgi:putative ABC transport system permease protein
MTLLRRLVSSMRWVLRRKRAEQELQNELQAFMDLATSEKIRDGIPPEEARRLAAVELGGLDQTKEHVRRFRHGGLIDQCGRDLRYALRTSIKQPVFSLVIVLTLGMGIGANTAIFSLIDALMLRWLPVQRPQDLLLLSMQPTDAREPGQNFSYAIVKGLGERSDIFTGVAGFSGYPLSVGPARTVTRQSVAMVTGQYYSTLGLSPVAGRLLTPEDDQPGAPPVAVLSYGYWEREFAKSPSAIGQTILLNGVPAAIVGISPPRFVGANVGSVADITVAAASLPLFAPDAAPLLTPGNFWLRVLVRPRPDVSIDETRARLAALWSEMGDRVIAAHWPASRRKAFAEAVFYMTPGGTGWINPSLNYEKQLVVLMAIVGVVLLIACANVASLLLARASARRREMAVRLAIGASRGRIIGQLLTESMLLAFSGAALAVGMAWFFARFLVATIATGPFPVTFDLTPNWHTLGFTAGIATITGLLFGLAPSFQITAVGPSAVLAEEPRRSASLSRLLPSLVSFQVALTVVLLIAAGLFVRTLRNLQTLDIGFNREGIFVAELEGRRTAVGADVVAAIEQVPGMVSVTVSTHTPLNGSLWSEPAVPAGQSLPDRDTALFVGAGPRFFETMQTPLLTGREFTERDSAQAAPVALINEAFAARFFPRQNPLGQHLSARVRGQLRDLEIIGLVKSTNAAGLRRPPNATVYVSYAQLTGDFPTTISMRVRGSLGETASAILKLLREKFPNAPVQVQPISQQVQAQMVQERLMATLAGGFGILALLLACIGLYGLLAYRVARLTREIGIRMALGAERKQVTAMVLRGAARLVAFGVVLGLPAAWGTSRWIEELLFGLKPTDPATVARAILVLVIVSLVAAYLPARRASRVDPMVALRHD